LHNCSSLLLVIFIIFYYAYCTNYTSFPGTSWRTHHFPISLHLLLRGYILYTKNRQWPLFSQNIGFPLYPEEVSGFVELDICCFLVFSCSEELGWYTQYSLGSENKLTFCTESYKHASVEGYNIISITLTDNHQEMKTVPANTTLRILENLVSRLCLFKAEPCGGSFDNLMLPVSVKRSRQWELLPNKDCGVICKQAVDPSLSH
jgi:hypothetical protein